MKLIKIDDYFTLVSDEEIKENYPQIVAEKLITGIWEYCQIDNINDIDKKNQKVIIASNDSKLNLPNITFSDEVADNKIEWEVEIGWKCSMCEGENYHKMSCKTPSLRTEEPKITNNSIRVIKII